MADYEQQFRRYENARLRYAQLQEDLREYLARFTGKPNSYEEPINIRDIATLEGLRLTRDIAFAEYSLAEATILKDLLGRISH